MKKTITFLLIFLLFFCACGQSDDDYERGFAAGYAAGYAAAPVETTVRAIPTTDPTTDTTTAGDFNVYISSSFTMHKKSTCSGMKNYITMPYSVAKDYFTKKCGTCFK